MEHERKAAVPGTVGAVVGNLDGSQIDHYGINKCTTFDHGKEVVWLTVYAMDNRHDEFDEQLSFTPEGLLDFCREVLRIANASLDRTAASAGTVGGFVGNSGGEQ